MKSRIDVSIVVDRWPIVNCTLMRLPHCEVVSEVNICYTSDWLIKFIIVELS